MDAEQNNAECAQTKRQCVTRCSTDDRVTLLRHSSRNGTRDNSWSHLPDGVMEGLERCLSTSTLDKSSFRLVCSGWKSAHDGFISSLSPGKLDGQLIGTVTYLFPNIQSLDLTRAEIAAGDVSTVVQRLPSLTRLEHLDLTGALGRSQRMLQSIRQRPQLRKISARAGAPGVEML
eukprot:scaffold244902_cov49-Prasinocladus_malaysianus.AAC.1